MEDVTKLKVVTDVRHFSLPDTFNETPDDILAIVYNGIGPERWSTCFRDLITKVFNALEACALVHDWEWTFQPKNYWAFTKSNIRLAYNAFKDHVGLLGLAGAALCQLFGYKGFKSATLDKLKEELAAKDIEPEETSTEEVK